jgi:hypothetical protein
MQKTIYSGTYHHFRIGEFEKLMHEMNAQLLGEENCGFDDSGWIRKGSPHHYLFYYLDKENVTAGYYGDEIMINIKLMGKEEDIAGVEKKVLETIATIKFDPEGFRLN